MVEYFESTFFAPFVTPFVIQVDFMELAFAEFLLLFLGKSKSFEDQVTMGCFSNCSVEDMQVLKAIINPKSNFWIETSEVVYNGCRILKGSELVEFMFPPGIVDALKSGSISDDFCKDYSKRFMEFALQSLNAI